MESRLAAAADCELRNSGTESDMLTMRAAMMTAKWRNFASRHHSGGVISFLGGHAQHFKDSYVTSAAGTYKARTGDIICNNAYRAARP
jgi:hypothetical protein